MFSVPAIEISGTLAEKSLSFSFPANVSNQKIDLYTTSSSALNALFDVVVVSTTGVISKRFTVTTASANTLSEQTTRYNEVMGSLGSIIAVSDVSYDATNSRWRLQIVQRTSQTTILPVSVNLRLLQATATAGTLINTFGLSSVYTTDTTAFPSAVFSFSGTISANSLITNIRTVSTATTLSTTDSTVLVNAGVTITLPAANSVSMGRPFTIKNLQQSAVTVVSAGGSTIDGVASTSVGNKIAYTFTSDGVSGWWITSTFK